MGRGRPGSSCGGGASGEGTTGTASEGRLQGEQHRDESGDKHGQDHCPPSVGSNATGYHRTSG